MFRYYCIMRPPAPGAIPKGALRAKSYSDRNYIPEIDRMAWGYVEYDEALTCDDIHNFELIAAPRDSSELTASELAYERKMVYDYVKLNALRLPRYWQKKGIYGTNTTAAVKAYQKAAGLEVTGVCDYTTYLSITSSNAPRIKGTETDHSNKENEYSYIGNRSTKKFHRSSCSEIKKMKESNKVGISSRDKAINNGYVPCKKCKP